jgi:hypothetical protein
VRISAGLLAVLALAACAGPQLTPVSEPARRLELRGLSVLPPKGESWFIVPKLAGEVPGVSGGVILVAFAKKPPADAGPRVLYALVSTYDLGSSVPENPGAFLRHVREELKQGTARQRVLDLQASLESNPAPTCARYRRASEMDENSILLTAGIMCRHPHWSRYAVDLSYGQRYRKGMQPLPLEAEVEAFLGGVQFTPERPVVE